MIYNIENGYLNIDIDSLYVETIQDFFDAYIPSKKIQHLLIQNKQILLDGNPVKRESDIVGLKLNICLYPETYSYEKIQDDILNVVYEDEIILVVNKPKGIIVHSDGNDTDTLKKRVESYYADTPHISAMPLHRLDKETCGMVVFSKSPVFQPLLDSLMSQKQIRREYLAFVEGKMEVDKMFTINKPIGNDRHNSGKKVIYKNGQKALTKVRCIGLNKKHSYSVLRCTLDTGRTHQIRVHLASEGYPILNDELYGRKSTLCVRMGLIADELEFYHPLKEEIMNISIDLPNDIGKLYEEAVR